jgi:hypothetical protein
MLVFDIAVSGRTMLAEALRRLRRIDGVIKVSRQKG